MPLRLVMPLSQRDANQIAANIDLFRALGGAPRHQIMLCPTRSVIPHAHQAAERLKGWCAGVEVIEWNDENYNVQPVAGNNMFRHCVEQITIKWMQGDHTPFFFMEADVTPLKAGWADDLERDYALSGAKFMGTRMKSRVITGKDASGKLTFTTDEFIVGQPQNIPFMVGVAIYSADVDHFTQGCCNMMMGESWDKACKFYWNRSLHVTKLIQHQWRTVNFREVEGKIICDDSQENKEQAYTEAGELSSEAVIHHGCKDGSLAKIIRSHCTELPEPPAPFVELQQPTRHAAPIQPVNSNPNGVTFDQTGWNVLQNSLMASGAQQPPTPQASVPLLQFEAPVAPQPQESVISQQQAKPMVQKPVTKTGKKRGRPAKLVNA